MGSPLLVHDYFESINTEKKAYFLGFLFADGNVDKRYNKIQLQLHKQDKEILEKLKSSLGSNNNLVKWKNSLKLNIISPKMKQDLIKYGCIPNKTFICKFPKLEKEMVPHFIRGYFDGDGSYSNNKIQIAGNYDFLEQMQIQIPIHSYIYKDRMIWKLCIQKKEHVILFRQWVINDATIYLTRKWSNV